MPITRSRLRLFAEHELPGCFVVMLFVLVLVLGLRLICGCATAMGTAFEATVQTVDMAERAEGDAAIDAAATRAEAEAKLVAVRERWRPVWRALAVALSAYLAGDDWIAAWCAFRRTAPAIGLPEIVVCP